MSLFRFERGSTGAYAPYLSSLSIHLPLAVPETECSWAEAQSFYLPIAWFQDSFRTPEDPSPWGLDPLNPSEQHTASKDSGPIQEYLPRPASQVESGIYIEFSCMGDIKSLQQCFDTPVFVEEMFKARTILVPTQQSGTCAWIILCLVWQRQNMVGCLTWGIIRLKITVDRVSPLLDICIRYRHQFTKAWKVQHATHSHTLVCVIRHSVNY